MNEIEQIKQKESTIQLLIRDVSVPFADGDEAILHSAEKRLSHIGIRGADLQISKKSVDARRRFEIRFVASVIATLPADRWHADYAKRLGREKIQILEPSVLRLSKGTAKLTAPPVVVGMGPAGLFAALLLAREGYKPTIIDRGGDIVDREACVHRFFTQQILDPECNIQYGAGGAGTFSDGKLLTRINDARCGYVLAELCRFGAPQDILTRAKPHIGTDLLRVVVGRMLEEIRSLGGRVEYRCRMDGFTEHADGHLTLQTSKGDLQAGALLLAPGNSARDTFTLLMQKGFLLKPKPISVGVRIEHLREDIDRMCYGEAAGHPLLGAAEYALSDTTLARGVYTFCMCPGGSVVAAASEQGGVVVNGMSERARDGVNSNAAVAVSVRCEDYAGMAGTGEQNPIEDAICFVRRIEQAAYRAGGSTYAAPIQTVGDFLNGTTGGQPTRVRPTYMNGFCKPCDLSEIFPRFVTENLRAGLRSFDRKLPGFAMPEAILTAAETRTSAPLRILREEETLCAVGHPTVYPMGEGAGYAGGITSAAVDGIRAASALMAKYGA